MKNRFMIGLAVAVVTVATVSGFVSIKNEMAEISPHEPSVLRQHAQFSPPDPSITRYS